jgi:hypothetical protein
MISENDISVFQHLLFESQRLMRANTYFKIPSLSPCYGTRSTAYTDFEIRKVDENYVCLR